MNQIPTELGLNVSAVSSIIVAFIRAKYKLRPEEYDVSVLYPFIPECIVKIKKKGR